MKPQDLEAPTLPYRENPVQAQELAIHNTERRRTFPALPGEAAEQF